jgi:hypothetical protein
MSYSIASFAVVSRVGGIVSPSNRGRLGVDDQLELARLHNRQLRGLGVVKDRPAKKPHWRHAIHNVGCIAHQPADFGKIPRGI